MRRFSLKSLLPVAAACASVVFATGAQAQLVDELEWHQEGNHAIVEIRFVTPVQYAKSIASASADLVQVFYHVLPASETLNLTNSERHLAGAGKLPSVSVLDEAANTFVNTVGDRKLVVHFDAARRFQVRAGRDNRTLEIVLEGLGESVKLANANLPPELEQHLKYDVPVALPDASAEVQAQAAALLAQAQSAFDSGNYASATETLNKLLALSHNASSRRAQELAGLAALNAGNKERASAEFELFLKLYPAGLDSDRVRTLLAGLPKAPSGEPAKAKLTTAAAATSGSVSMFYYGGNSDTRTQDFINSPLSSLPVLQSESTLSAVDQRQIQTNLDLNWRLRDADKDMRMVFRDAYSSDLLNSNKSKSRLSAMYLDYRSLTNGTSLRLGRQSPNGGGVLYRFDGVQAGYAFQPKWKANVLFGQPSDPLLDASRHFYAVSLDALALTKELSGSVYLIEQVIDGVTDRRGLGTELRYFKAGVAASGQLDFDQILHAVNVAAFQSTWQVSESTVINGMFDRRTTPVLSLGNVLFFQNPGLLAPARRIQDLLGLPATNVDTLREQIKGLTPYQTQARLAATTRLTSKWQLGADLNLTSVDAIQPVVDLLPSGQPATGNLWGLSAQLIGTNLYSARDTHVFNVSALGGPNYHGTLLSYNNLSSLTDKWQLEPSVKYYTQGANDGSSSDVMTAGVRVAYHLRQQISLESELTYEKSDVTSGAGSKTSVARTNYYLGVRYEF